MTNRGRKIINRVTKHERRSHPDEVRHKNAGHAKDQNALVRLEVA
jgi:hypothetical protein